MPLQPPYTNGKSNLRSNVNELMQPTANKTRKRAINTIARKRNVPRKQAQFIQSLARKWC